jgi:hypothetical protein
LLEERREGAAESPDLSLVDPEGRKDDEHPDDDEDYPAGRDAEPAEVVDPPVLTLAQHAELEVLLELGAVGFVELVQAHAHDPGPDSRGEQPPER